MMANEQKWPDWPVLQMRWGREQLVKRRKRGDTTDAHNILRLLDWMAMVINATHREYQRREALAKQVTDLSRQIIALKQELEIVKELAQVESGEDEP